MKKLASLQAGTLGELLTVAKLNTLGLAAYISPERAPGHYVVVVVAGEPKSIEVKTRQFMARPTEISRWPVNMNSKGDADFFIFVELGLSTLSPTFYLLTNAQAREAYRDHVGSGSCSPRTFGFLANLAWEVGSVKAGPQPSTYASPPSRLSLPVR